VKEDYNNFSKKAKFSLEEIIAEKPEYLLEQIRAELPQKPLRNGSQMRITTLINICDLLEKNFRKLDSIESQLYEIKSDIARSNYAYCGRIKNQPRRD
jgi:hypothetical protein